jgi:hypothetical protein
LIAFLRFFLHPSSGGNSALKGRVFQKWLGEGAKPPPTTKIPGLKAWVQALIPFLGLRGMELKHEEKSIKNQNN